MAPSVGTTKAKDCHAVVSNWLHNKGNVQASVEHKCFWIKTQTQLIKNKDFNVLIVIRRSIVVSLCTIYYYQTVLYIFIY